MGRLGDAYVFASETCAFETVGATYERDVQPGEMLVLDRDGLREDRFAEAGAPCDLCDGIYLFCSSGQ